MCYCPYLLDLEHRLDGGHDHVILGPLQAFEVDLGDPGAHGPEVDAAAIVATARLARVDVPHPGRKAPLVRNSFVYFVDDTNFCGLSWSSGWLNISVNSIFSKVR